METRVISAHVTADLAKQLDEAAARIDRPKGWIVKQALNSWLDLEERRYQLTLEALEDVDAGRVVEHTAIGEWLRGRRKSTGS